MTEYYIEKTLKKYLDDLGAKLPAPGGGSASALVSATGTALLSMTSNFTVDKKGYEQYQEEIKEILSELESGQKRLCELIDIDVKVYEKVATAYKLPKNTDDEKRIREQQIQQVLKEALEVPYEIITVSQKMIIIAERLTVIGNKNLISDVGCGTNFLLAGIESAKFNVDINLKYITDKDYVKIKRESVEKVVIQCREKANNILAEVNKQLY